LHFGNFPRLCKFSVTGLEGPPVECFYRLMQALSDDQHIAAIEAKVDKLEKKIDAGFAEMRAQILASERALRGEITSARSDARQDFRTLLAVIFGMWTTTVLAVVGVLASHL
jgi:hypothetical protein